MEIKPQPGPQTQFLSCPADIAFYGGAAGGGKSWSLLVNALRHMYVKDCRVVFLRREMPQIRLGGGLWDECEGIYEPAGFELRESVTKGWFHNRMSFEMTSIQYEKDLKNFQSSQFAVINFDELTQFTKKQFWYMQSRNRSTCGIRPYTRGAMNPDPDSFVKEMIDWYIDDDGFAIPERSGVIRFFFRQDDELVWADTKEKLLKYSDVESEDILSFSFIPAKLSDNEILMQKDPSYKAKLKALPYVERMQLLEGNWKIRPKAGLYFKREYFTILETPPLARLTVRFWDRAGTEKKQNNNPDWTVGTKVQLNENGRYTVLDVVRFQGTPFNVREKIKAVAQADGSSVQIGLEQEPGASGKSEVNHLILYLSGFNARAFPAKSDKITRASPASAQAEQGNIDVLRAEWNDAWFSELEAFPEGKKDDQVDSFSGAFDMLTVNNRTPSISVANSDDDIDDGDDWDDDIDDD